MTHNNLKLLQQRQGKVTDLSSTAATLHQNASKFQELAQKMRHKRVTPYNESVSATSFRRILTPPTRKKLHAVRTKYTNISDAELDLMGGEQPRRKHSFSEPKNHYGSSRGWMDKALDMMDNCCGMRL